MTTRADGFTLVELLIALTLVAMLSVMLFGGLRFGTRAVTVADARIDRAAEITTAYGFLQNAIGNAQLLPTLAQSSESGIKFSGSRDQLDFVTSPPAQLALGGFHRVHLGLEDGDNGRRLTIAWHVLSRAAPEVRISEVAPSLLVDRVSAVAFAYLVAPQQGASPEWRDEWVSATDLPLLVRLRITLADGWQAPDFVIAPLTWRRAQH
jgi:general secretion pathway protein J